MSGVSRFASLLTVALLTGVNLSACVDRDLPANIIEDLNQQNVLLALNLRFEFPSPRPAYLTAVTEVAVEVFTRGRSQPVRDRFALNISETTTDLQRSLTRVPGGQLEARVQLLNAEGNAVQTLNQTWTSQGSSADLLITLSETPVILVSTQSSDLPQDTATLRARQVTLNQELRTLQQTEADLRAQLRLFPAPTLEDQVRREDIELQLQQNQRQQTEVQTALDTLNAQLIRLEAQGGSSPQDDRATLQAQLASLRTQITTVQAELGRLLERRTTLTGQINSQFDDNQLREQWQAELQQVSTELDQKTDELGGLASDLRSLETRLQAQGGATTPADDPAVLALEAEIAQKEAEIARIETDIEVWMESQDAIAITRRDQLQLELQARQAELVTLQQRYERLRG
ncbi:MAG: hypothetical protein IGS03_04500 [Candidatus Sericytochromatia bacterium]|nr:hypothetical protein [Candidatus Sericytochromatia bacterium]